MLVFVHLYLYYLQGTKINRITNLVYKHVMYAEQYVCDIVFARINAYTNHIQDIGVHRVIVLNLYQRNITQDTYVESVIFT